ncbi:MAG: excinuclease ABC subunit UvrC [Pseudomonadota bacterium]
MRDTDKPKDKVDLDEEGGRLADGPSLGHDVIQAYLPSLDLSPGVYRMLGENAEVLYVGKARQLKKRVASYAKPTGHSPRIARMISMTRSMMFLTTETETEALLLEQNLIKQLKPKFNVLLRDDKSFPNILVTKDHPFPMIRKHRGAKSRKGDYFGPFASANAVNRTLNQLQKIFQLRNCTDSMFASRTRPCLQYQIGRCSAPCVGLISEDDYAVSVKNAARFLRGGTSEIQEELAGEMQKASAAMEFERAAALRDRIRALTHVQSTQGVNPRTVSEADVIALFAEGGQACVQVYFIRAHQNWGNKAYFPRVAGDTSTTEIMQAFIGQFYGDRQPPKLIILSHEVEDMELVSDALSGKADRKVQMVVPQRGERHDLVMSAKRNAQQSLVRKLSENATQSRLLNKLADVFDLDGPPERVEVYDNSHIQGAFAVGAMIVAGPNGFEKSHYRKFNIKNDELTPGDDFGMMKEVLERRFKRLLKEDPDRQSGNWPDLVILDGGAGQVSAVEGIFAELGVEDMPFIGVAKGIDRDAGKEEFYRPGKPAFALQRNDEALYFVQRLRDEAHRFAIGSHRQKRSKAISATPLDDVPGIGPSRKRALLSHFGSAKAVSRAALADLKDVEGISEAMAKSIYDYFHENG